MSTLQIISSKKDLERFVEVVIDKLNTNKQKTRISGDLEDDRLSQKEAANFLRISVTSIISWKKKGLIPYYSIGNRVFYSKSELLKVARKNRHLIQSV